MIGPGDMRRLSGARGAAMTISRREAIYVSGSTLAGLSLGVLAGDNLQAQAAQQAEPWPDKLVERPQRSGFPAPLAPGCELVTTAKTVKPRSKKGR